MDQKTKIEVDDKKARLFELFCKHQDKITWLERKGLFEIKDAEFCILINKQGYFTSVKKILND